MNGRLIALDHLSSIATNTAVPELKAKGGAYVMGATEYEVVVAPEKAVAVNVAQV